MIFGNVFQSVILLAFFLLYRFNELSPVYFVILTMLIAIGARFVDVSETAMMPELINRDSIIRVNSLLAGSSSSNAIIGMGIGGIVVQLFGYTTPFFTTF